MDNVALILKGVGFAILAWIGVQVAKMASIVANSLIGRGSGVPKTITWLQP